MRVTLKFTRLAAHIAHGLLLAGLTRASPGRFPPERLAQRWHAKLLTMLGIEVVVRGTPPPGTAVVVANHVSWLDIPVLGSALPMRFVSKAEIADWPIAGWLADACGTFYLRRGAGGTKHLIHALDAQLRSGSIVFFPEGTTTDGQHLLHFQPRLFAAAIATHHPVQPVALRYAPAADGTVTAPFVGDDDLLTHLTRLIEHGPIRVELVWCPVIDSAGHDRDSLADAAFAAICSEVAPQQLADGRGLSRREAQARLAETAAGSAGNAAAPKAGWLRTMR